VDRREGEIEFGVVAVGKGSGGEGEEVRPVRDDEEGDGG
jgi:hypothetical protein